MGGDFGAPLMLVDPCGMNSLCMKPRWKVTLAALPVAALVAFAFVLFFSGINLDEGMVIERISRRGVRWVSLDGKHRDSYVEPLGHFLSGAAFLLAAVWACLATAMAPAGYLLGRLWERWRERPPAPSLSTSQGAGKGNVRAA